MSKQDSPRDGFLPKVLVGSVVVIWVSLVGGSWLGRYAVEKGFLGKSETTEFKQMPAQRPKPWVTVDPKQAEEVDANQSPEAAVPEVSATPDESSTPIEVVTSTPLPQPTGEAPKATPMPPEPTPADAGETPEAPLPTPKSVPTEAPVPENPAATPALGGSGSYQLQFGSFGSQENAQKMVDDLSKLGQSASVEELTIDGHKSFRVRGGSYTEDQARAQRDKLIEQNVKVYIVNNE